MQTKTIVGILQGQAYFDVNKMAALDAGDVIYSSDPESPAASKMSTTFTTPCNQACDFLQAKMDCEQNRVECEMEEESDLELYERADQISMLRQAIHEINKLEAVQSKSRDISPRQLRSVRRTQKR